MAALKIFLKIIFVLLVFTAAAVAYVWMKPQVVINEKNLRWFLQYAPENIKLSWEDLHFEFHNPDWTHKRIQLSARNLCFTYAPMLHTCAPTVSFDVAMAFTNWRPELEQLRQVKLELSELTLNLPTKDAPKEEPRSVLPNLKLPPFASLMPQKINFQLLGATYLKAKNVRVNFPEGPPLLAELELTRIDTQNPNELKFELTGQAQKDPTFSSHLQTKIRLDLKQLDVNGKISVVLPSLKLESPLNAVWNHELRAEAHPLIRFGKVQLDPQIKVHWSERLLNVDLGTIEMKNVWRRTSLRLKNCNINSMLDAELGYPAKAHVQCGLIVTPDKNRAGIKNIDTLLKASFTAHTQGQGEAERLRLNGDAEISGANTFLQGTIRLQGETEIAMQTPLKVTAANADAEVQLSIPDFVVWKNLFESTPLAVPAPLHVLTGTVTLQAQAHLPDLNSPLTAKATLQSRLGSSNQKLLTQAEAEVQTLGNIIKPRGLKIQSDLILQDVHLQAPPLRLAVPPQLLPDKRFVLRKDLDLHDETPKKEALKLPFELQWSVHVKTENPVQISSNLLPNPIPIDLDILAQHNRKPQGKVMVKSFPFEFFRKKATVNKIDLFFHPDTTAPELSGLISYSNPEVDIRIQLLGNTQRPIVNFESDPQLNQQQILSVLLFDKSLDELNEDEVSSTSNMSRAVSDGALGLFSLLFLSSTPIQSISYDPNSQSYTARMRLDDNTTFSMQSNMTEQRQFTLRRRLGGNWSVRTELSQDDKRADVIQTLLEWLHRF